MRKTIHGHEVSSPLPKCETLPFPADHCILFVPNVFSSFFSVLLVTSKAVASFSLLASFEQTPSLKLCAKIWISSRIRGDFSTKSQTSQSMRTVTAPRICSEKVASWKSALNAHFDEKQSVTQLLTQCCISLILAQEVDFASVNALKKIN